MGSKKEVLKLRSLINIVKPPAKTGKLNNNNQVVHKILQLNKLKEIKLLLEEKKVTIKFIEETRDLTPATWRLKIKKSTLFSGSPKVEKGGYKVHPVPGKTFWKKDNKINLKAGNNNQKLKFFKRGKAISGILQWIGIIQFPKPPTVMGITKKKIINNACKVTTEL